MEESVHLGLELGYLRLPPGLLAAPGEASGLRAREACVLVTGTQGEPRSALARLARGEHPDLRVEPGDRVVLSSRFIPGNEVAIGRVLDALTARGAEVLWEEFRALHASGHAHEEEQRRLVRLARPEHFVPIHGELRHLARHAAHAAAEGVPDAGRPLLEDGEVLELADAGARRLERVAAGRTWLERDAAFATVAESVIRERRSLAHRGLAAVVMALDAAGALAAAPQVRGRGVSGLAGREAEVAGEAARALEGMAGEDRLDPDRVEAAVARAVRAWFRREGRPRPAVPVVGVAI